jgi:hypothetical protein
MDFDHRRATALSNLYLDRLSIRTKDPDGMRVALGMNAKYAMWIVVAQ